MKKFDVLENLTQYLSSKQTLKVIRNIAICSCGLSENLIYSFCSIAVPRICSVSTDFIVLHLLVCNV